MRQTTERERLKDYDGKLKSNQIYLLTFSEIPNLCNLYTYLQIMEKETEKQKLIAELNQLSENFEKNKQRMIEIARILLHDHY